MYALYKCLPSVLMDVTVIERLWHTNVAVPLVPDAGVCQAGDIAAEAYTRLRVKFCCI